jgi:hypothetical protein
VASLGVFRLVLVDGFWCMIVLLSVQRMTLMKTFKKNHRPSPFLPVMNEPVNEGGGASELMNEVNQ